MVAALAVALNRLTAAAAPKGLLPKRIMKKRPSNINMGAPGGWGNCNLYAQAMNSPVSHKLPLASRVRK